MNKIFLILTMMLFVSSCQKSSETDGDNCMDIEAYNYNPDATTDDGSCLYCSDFENQTACDESDDCEWHVHDDVGLCQDHGDEDDEGDDDELEGSWVGSIINDGFPENEYTFTFTNNNFELTGTINDDDAVLPIIGSGTFTTNKEVEPSQVDVTIISYVISGEPVEEYEGLTALGIYEIEGDTLKFAGAEPGTLERPSNFTGNEEGMQVYLLIRD